MSLQSRLHSVFKTSVTASLPSVGVYHFVHESGEDKSRIHLRIDGDGSGMLIINANQIFHLNPTAASMSFFHLNRLPVETSIKALKKAFDVSDSEALLDYQSAVQLIDQLIKSDNCPVCDLDLEINAPFSSKPSAPYRMDLAITYRCNNACSHCYNARPRNYPELSTNLWFEVLDKLWEIGIPHVVFTGGEPTSRNDLPALIKYAEEKGQITGLNTNGRKLSDEDYLNTLVNSGLDHIQITFESNVPDIHDAMVCHSGAWSQTTAGLKNAIKNHKYVMTNTTMLSTNKHTILDTLHFLGDLGVRTVGLNALIYSGKGKTVGTGLSESELHQLLSKAKVITESYGQRLIWYTPTQYCNFDPVLNDLGVKGCTAALYNMCIEPNGDVIPCQSYYSSVGNFLSTEWEIIWNHSLCTSLRERRYLSEKCKGCLLVSECGGGCPLIVEN
jgi:radical SAM protein with 4Fe4S-binding SPASM domain